MNNTYHIITIGCAMNKSDSERISKYFEEHNYVWSHKTSEADVLVINTCGIRQTAEDRVYGFVNQARKDNDKVRIIITGCLSKREDVRKRLKDRVDLWMPINELPNLNNFLDSKENIPIESMDKIREIRGEDYLKIIPKYNSKFSSLVPIGNGCNNFCAYCVVPYARGREVYRPFNDILKEVQDLIKNGCKEITLIAQNVNSYKSNDKNFTDLLKEIDKIEGDFWIRFLTSHPKDMSDELIEEIGKNSKLCKHVHMAVQSGDNDILKIMNRKYTIEHYVDLIKKIRKAKKDISITTDIIVGFPGETKKQFKKTAKLFKKIEYDMAYISQYSPRHGTVSEKMEDNVTSEEKRDREEYLTKILRKTAYKNNKKHLNKELTVLVEGINRKGKMYGKTSGYKNVKIMNTKERKDLIGQFVSVRILEIQDFGLIGELIN